MKYDSRPRSDRLRDNKRSVFGSLAVAATGIAAIGALMWMGAPSSHGAELVTSSAHPDDVVDPSIGFWQPHLMSNRPCPAEDGPIHCRWLAHERGNHVGHDVRYDRYGVAFKRFRPIGEHRHCWIHVGHRVERNGHMVWQPSLVWCGDGYRGLS